MAHGTHKLTVEKNQLNLFTNQ